MVFKVPWFTRCALALLAVQLTACPDPQPPSPGDTTPPSTRAAPVGGTYTSAQTVTLTCEDGSGSGCDATYYTTDGSNPTTGSTRYANPLSLRSTTTLKFFSVDKAGNPEVVRTEAYTINIPPADTQAPTTSAAPAGGTYNAAQTVTLACNDGTGSGCANTYYTVDGSEPTASSTRYTAPIDIAASATLKFFSLDQAGNQEAVRTEAYVIDTQAPTTAASPAGGTYNSAQAVTLACNDGTGTGCANTYYTTNGSNPTTSSTPYTTPIAVAANTTLKFFSVDQAGNPEAVRTETYVIDTQAPATAASPAGGTYSSAQTVTLSCNDGTGTGCAGTYLTTDGSEPTTSSTPYTTPIAIAANTTLKFFSVDGAGNSGAVRTETYVIDTQAPSTVAAPLGGSYNAAQTVTLSCNDGSGTGCAGTYYTTDGSNPTTGSTPYLIPFSVFTTTTLKFFSVDQAGNPEAVRTESYVIDTQAPTTTAAPAGGNYGTAQSVTLACSDDSGTGCNGTYYTVDGSEPTTGSTPYTGTIAIATSTTLKFFSVDSVGNAEAVRTETYVIDTQPPTTSASPAGGTYDELQTVRLECSDGAGGSGCANTYYTTDGSEPTTSSPLYTGPIDIEGNTTLKFFSVDSVGNAEAVRTESYTINAPDTRAPTTTATPAGGNYNTAQSVTLTCTDGVGGSGCASTYYTTDGSEPTTGSPPYTAPIAIAANTTLRFFSVDNQGNQETSRTAMYVIDMQAPTTTATPAGGTYNAAQSVTLACSDEADGSGCANTYYTTDGSEPTTGSTRYTAPIALAANTTLKFFSVDRAGNAEAVRTEAYVIDTTAPTTTATPAGGAYGAAQTVTLTCNDGTGGTGCTDTYYTVDGSEPTTGSAPYTAPIAIAANTTLKFFSVDGAGNAETIRTESYTIDTAAPTTTASPVGGTYNAVQSITLTCSDEAGGSNCDATYYTTDGSEPTTGSTRYTAPIALAANTTLKFFSVDRAGNSEAVRTEAYVIDTTAPTTTATPAGGAYSAAQTVALTCNDGTGGTGCTDTYYTVDGSDPTTSSERYTAPIAIADTTTLKFFSVDGVGNQEQIRAERYVIDTQAPTTTASPAGGAYDAAQTVTLACTDGSGDSSSGCGNTYYTTDGSNPTTSSPRYTGPLSIAVDTTLKFFSVDDAGNQEPIRTESYSISGDVSGQIAAIRSTTDTTINLPITQALVTYVRPLIGNDPAGFFLQAERNGPAIFIAVDPANLTPTPAVGDRISFIATQRAVQESQIRVTALSSYSRSSQGESVEPLRVDVSNISLPTVLNDYESELISISGTLTSTFSSSGSGHQQATLSTSGVSNNTNQRLRLPTTLVDQLDLVNSCSVTVHSPLWRFNTTAQPSIWVPADLIAATCPAPRVVSAIAAGTNAVTVRFDRRIKPGSVLANGSQFIFTNGLEATAATVVDREVRVTTNAQTIGGSYRVTVATTVTDIYDTPLNSTTTTADFIGYQPAATLRLTEAIPNIGSSKDVVELIALQGGFVTNFTLVQEDNGGPNTLATLPNVQVTAGDVIVIHLNATGTGYAPGSETTAKNQHPQATYSNNYDTAWDFYGGATGLSFSHRVVRIRDATGTTQDAVPFVQPSVSTAPGAFPTHLQTLQGQGLWLPNNCNNAPCTYTSSPTAVEVSVTWEGTSSDRSTSVSRISATDTNTKDDWAVGASSLGLPNP